MKIKILFVMLLLLCVSVTAFDTYNETGNYDKNYRTETGFFSENTNATIEPRALGTPRQTPIVTDLNNDGINEIIVLDDKTFRLYHNKELDTVSSYTSANITGTAYFISYDIDGDNYIELISVDDLSGKIEIVEYNGTSIHLQNSFDLGGNHDNGEVMLACKGTEDCFVVYIEEDLCAGAGCETYIRGRFFNSTFLGDQAYFDSSNRNGVGGTTKSTLCFPKIRHIQVADYDFDGQTEYIFSLMDVIIKNPEVDDDVLIYYVSMNSTPAPVREQIIEETDTDDFSNLIQAGCGSADYGKRFSSPLVYDFDISGNVLETVLAYQIDDTDYNMKSYDYLGGEIDDYPEVTDAEGTIVSNVFRANAFDDNKNVDFCVVGFVEEADLFNSPCTGGHACLDVLCGSIDNTFNLKQSIQFGYDLDDDYNITITYDFWNTISHATSMKTGDVPDIDEILTTYGVFDMELTGLDNYAPLTKIFDITQEDGVLISADVERVGRDDLLYMTLTNIFYYDDGYTNSGGEISSYTINPCLDSTWKQNTTVSVNIEVIDVDDNNVNSEVILYYGGNEQTSQSVNGSSGTTFSHSFTANETIGTGVLRLIGRDDQDSTGDDIIDLSFSVSTNGVEFGDCITTIDVTTTAEEDEAVSQLQDDNVIVTGINSVDNTFGWGLGGSILWLMFMFIVAFAIWVAKSSFSPTATFGVIGIVETLLLVIGTKLGILSSGILITVVVISLLFIGIWLRKMFTSD